jgi:hypothetical protein
MANYTFFLSDGVTPITVTDSTINNLYSVPLLGQNVTSFGDDVALGTMRHLENFAATVPPNSNPNIGGGVASVLKGQLWFDTANNVLNVNVGTTATPSWQEIAGAAQGTVTDAAARWTGTVWEEEERVQISSTGTFTIFDSSLSDSVAMSHNGTDFTMATTNVDAFIIDGVNNYVQINDSAELRVSGGAGNSQSLEIVPYELALGDFIGKIRTVGLQKLRIGSSISTMSLEGSLSLQERVSAYTDELGFGQVWVNSADNGLYYTNESGTDVRLDVTAGGTLTGGGTNNQIATWSGATSLDGSANLTFDGTNLTMPTNATGIRLNSTTDASLASTTHPFQIGPTAGQNMVFDANEILSRNNGAADDLYLNNDGGAVRIGTATPGALRIDSGGSLLVSDSGNNYTVSFSTNATNATFDGGAGPSGALGGFLAFQNFNAGYYFQDGQIWITNHGGSAIEMRATGNDTAATNYLRFEDADLTGKWHVGQQTIGSSDGEDFTIRRVGGAAGVHFRVIGASNSTQFEVQENGAVTSYYAGTSAMGTQSIIARTSRAWVKDTGGTQRDIGFNQTPSQYLGTGTTALDETNAGKYLYRYTIGGSSVVQLNSDLSIPTGTTWIVSNWQQNTDSGTCTIEENGVTLYWLDGGGASDAPTGDRTLAKQGVCTIRKHSTTQYHIWGNGLS